MTTARERFGFLTGAVIAILVIGLLGLVMDQVMKFTGKRIFRWAE